MNFSIPGTNISFDLDIPNPADEAKKILKKVQDLIDDVLSNIGDFFESFMSKIGSGFRDLVNKVPNTVFEAVKTGVKNLWNAFTGKK